MNTKPFKIIAKETIMVVLGLQCGCTHFAMPNSSSLKYIDSIKNPFGIINQLQQSSSASPPSNLPDNIVSSLVGNTMDPLF